MVKNKESKVNNKHNKLDFEEPLQLENHKRPVTRRDFLGQGLIAGGAAIIAPTLLGVLGPNAYAAVTETDCGVISRAGGTGKVPFIAVDLSGGANIAGSNVLVGGIAGQRDFLSAEGYQKLGLPATMLPSLANQISTLDQAGLGLAFHANSAMLAGIRDVASQTTLNNVNGSVMCARSSNDTGDNPHNPMYGIYKAGADGDVVSLIGSRSSDSGGRSRAPASMMDLSVRPTKIASGNDARGLVDTGKLAELLPNEADAVNVMQAMQRISAKKLSKIPETAALKTLVECGYLESALAASGNPDRTNIDADTVLQSMFNPVNNLDIADFGKTASVAKLVINGLAGAGTVQFGGYDYHNSTRTTGETRDRTAGQQIGIALEYASLMNKPVMIYVFSDGSVASDGTLDSTGKGIWKGDNSSTASSLMLIYSPNGMPQIANTKVGDAKNQLGYFKATGSIQTSASVISNNVDQLAEAVVLNYMALHNEVGMFAGLFPQHGLGADLDALTAFQPILPIA